MLLADLKSMAGGMGVPGAGSMKKAQLVEAIKAAQAGASSSGASAPKVTTTVRTPRTAPVRDAQPAPAETKAETKPETKPETKSEPANDARAERGARVETQTESQAEGKTEVRTETRAETTSVAGAGREASAAPTPTVEVTSRQRSRNRQAGQQGNQQAGQQERAEQKPEQRPEQMPEQRQGNQPERAAQKSPERPAEKPADRQGNQQANQQGQARNQQQPAQQGGQQQGGQQLADDFDDDGEGGSRRNRRRRGRDRERQANRVPGGRNEPDTTVLEDDVLVPAAGILDVLDNYAFVRTSGYLPGTDDVYLSLSMVRKFGLRRGDAVVGQVRQPREGERKEKFNPMVRIDSVNGTDPEAARERLEFETFTPVHPTERLRLETDAANLTGRVIDIAAPIGKGQRGLIVAPPKSGRTTLLQSVAQSVSRNNPEVHLMVVLLDARPEEVTDFQRAVKGEVIASTFDRAASDHTMLAELAIERAKRLVELGHDVVVLLDSVTSLARAYNVSAPATGRTLAGGVDAGAVHPPKQIFGAARNVEGGGSLTILATVVVETGSATDEVIFEEFGGTANMELRLRRELAEAHTFPAVDIVASGTRQEALLSSEQEAGIVQSLRRRMSSEPTASVDAVLDQIRKAQNNIEFLTKQQQKPGSGRGN
jgi:transcription termination factor Rho